MHGALPQLLRHWIVAVFDIGSDEPPPHGAGGVDVWDLASAISSEEPPMRSPGGQPVKKHCHPKDKECGKPGGPLAVRLASDLAELFLGLLADGWAWHSGSILHRSSSCSGVLQIGSLYGSRTRSY